MKKSGVVLSVFLTFSLLLFPQTGAAGKAASGEQPSLVRFVLENPLPEIPQELMGYKVISPKVTRERVKKLMDAFGMKGEIKDRGTTLAVRDGGKELVCWKAEGTGYIRFSDDDALFSREAAKKLPDDKEAVVKAEAFLKELNLLPPEAFLSGTGAFRERQYGPKASAEVRRKGVQVGFGMKLIGEKVKGPGAKAGVIFGEKGKVIAAYRMWREVAPGEKMKIISSEEAFRLFKKRWPPEAAGREQDGKARINVTVRVKEIATAWYAYPASEPMSILSPVYVFSGDYTRKGVLGGREVHTVENFRIFIPATPGDKGIPWSL